MNRFNIKHLLRNIPAQISTKKQHRVRLTFFSTYLKLKINVLNPLKEQRTQSLDDTWTYGLKKDRLSAALLPFQLRADTARYWLSKPRGWVCDQRGRLMFCPANKTNETTTWPWVAKMWTLQVQFWSKEGVWFHLQVGSDTAKHLQISPTSTS